MHNNNPGIIIPPPPDKQAVGRFDADFVESRRAALERMLNKIAAHSVLQHDGDLKLFLESDAFNVDIKNRERKEPGLGESKGMFGGMLSGGTGKFVEHDDVGSSSLLWLQLLTPVVVPRSQSIPRRSGESAQSPAKGDRHRGRTTEGLGRRLRRLLCFVACAFYRRTLAISFRPAR
jgi:hypothetical protein